MQKLKVDNVNTESCNGDLTIDTDYSKDELTAAFGEQSEECNGLKVSHDRLI